MARLREKAPKDAARQAFVSRVVQLPVDVSASAALFKISNLEQNKICHKKSERHDSKRIVLHELQQLCNI